MFVSAFENYEDSHSLLPSIAAAAVNKIADYVSGSTDKEGAKIVQFPVNEQTGRPHITEELAKKAA